LIQSTEIVSVLLELVLFFVGFVELLLNICNQPFIIIVLNQGCIFKANNQSFNIKFCQSVDNTSFFFCKFQLLNTFWTHTENSKTFLVNSRFFFHDISILSLSCFIFSILFIKSNFLSLYSSLSMISSNNKSVNFFS